MSIGQKQRLDKLRFYLYDRPLHPELFDIYRDHHVVKSGYEAQVWITGCSHVIGVFRPEGCLVQATAEADAELPQRGGLLELPFHGEREHERKRHCGLSYMMSLQVEEMSRNVFSRTHHELARLGSRRGLFVPFPQWMHERLTPFTYVDYEARANEFHVFTFHAFPDQLTLVKTQSIFELA